MLSNLFALLKVKKKWGYPKKTDIVIFDNTGADVIINNLDSYTYEILYVRYEYINIPILLLSIFGNKLPLSTRYIDNFIKKANPKLVITFIDNNPAFYGISYRHANIKTIAIQNGYRANAHLFNYLDRFASKQTFYSDYLLLYGPGIAKKYLEFINGTAVSIGSMKNNIISHNVEKIHNSIGFISQFRSAKNINIGKDSFVWSDLWDKPNKFILQFLIKYCKDNKKKLYVIPSSKTEHTLENEKKYFKRLLGIDLNFMDCNNGYVCVDRCEVTVGVDSTLGYESLSRGNKTAIFSLRSHYQGWQDRKFGWPNKFPDTGKCWTNVPDVAVFRKIIDYLFTVSSFNWTFFLRKSSINNILKYDTDNAIFKSILEKEL
jgi:surface carbohydrate biosynthesis protein